MKAQPLVAIKDGTGLAACEPTEATSILLHMPGPLPDRRIPVVRADGAKVGKGPHWTWNGSVDSPSLVPSIRTRGSHQGQNHLCHSFVTVGKVKFLKDCSHELAGKTMDLLEVEW